MSLGEFHSIATPIFSILLYFVITCVPSLFQGIQWRRWFINFAIMCVVLFIAVYGVNSGIGITIAISGLFSAIYIIGAKNSDRKEERRKVDEQRAIEIAEKEKAKKEHNDLIASGNWRFEEDSFYLKCKESGITSISDTYSREKVALIGKQMLKSNNIDEQYIPMYLSQIEDIFNESFAEHQRKLHQIELDKLLIVDNKVYGSDKEACEMYKKMDGIYGRDKRKLYCTTEIEKCQKELDEIKRKCDEELDKNDASKSYNFNKSDASIVGGISSAIAGPAAGLMAAIDTSRRNDAIDEYNKSLMMSCALGSAIALNEKREKSKPYEETISKMKKELEEIECKVVFEDISTEDIYKDLVINSKPVYDSYYNRVSLKVELTNNYVPSVPDGVNPVVDGMFTAKIYCDGTHFDTFRVPLDKYGIKCNGGKNSLTVYPNKFMQGQIGEYTVEIFPEKLWVMEA